MTKYLSMSGSSDRSHQIAGTAWAFCVLSTIAVLLRIYCRVFIVKSFGLDDWTAVLAQIFFMVFCGCCITGTHYGTGRHTADIAAWSLPVGLRWWWYCEPLYILVNMFLKFSIAIFLLRIAVLKTHKLIIWASLAISEVYGLFFFLVFICQCQPTSFFWNRYAPGNDGKGYCINVNVTAGVFFGYTAVCCLTDWILSILPGFMVWNLQMNSRTKLSVALILAVGAIASTATIIRIPYLKNITDSDDFLYGTSDIAIWSTVETGIGITASALATLRPLFRSFLSHSRFLGGSSSNPASKAFPGSRVGYQRSTTKHTNNEEFDLRTDINRGNGVVTMINVPGNDEERAMGLSDLKGGAESSRNLKGGGWGNEASALADDSSEEFNNNEPWKVEVSKTIVQTHDAV